jgi:hypothetical protein
VHHCGHDCIPWDVCVHQLSDLLRQHGDSISRVDCFDEIAFAASGGTLYAAAPSITATPPPLASLPLPRCLSLR